MPSMNFLLHEPLAHANEMDVARAGRRTRSPRSARHPAAVIERVRGRVAPRHARSAARA
jgi:hypothetical protein